MKSAAHLAAALCFVCLAALPLVLRRQPPNKLSQKHTTAAQRKDSVLAATPRADSIPLRLTQIAGAFGGNVWGVDAAERIWRYDPAIESWDSIPGSLAQIAVAFDGAVWGINSAQQIWRFGDSTRRHKIGTASQVH